MSHILERLLVLPQYLIPQHALSRLVYKLTRSEIRWIKNLLIQSFSAAYKIDMERAENSNPTSYASFNHFFTRAMKDISFTKDKNIVISPCDGLVSQYGAIHKGSLVQAKGHTFSVHELLAFTPNSNEDSFSSGSYATVYLSPRDYHRIHMPVDAQLLEMTYVPGDLFAVNQRTTRVVNNLFSRNERVVCKFRADSFDFYLVLVGAIFVGNMETVWAGEINQLKDKKIRKHDYSSNNIPIILKRGEEMGRFNMGSTVIMVIPNHPVTFHENVLQAPVKTGDSIATLSP